MPKNAFAAGASPRTPLGELTALPRPLAALGMAGEERGGEGKDRKGGEGRGGEGKEGKVREGREEEGGEGTVAVGSAPETTYSR